MSRYSRRASALGFGPEYHRLGPDGQCRVGVVDPARRQGREVVQRARIIWSMVADATRWPAAARKPDVIG